jgi:Uma2 family endonuclease
MKEGCAVQIAKRTRKPDEAGAARGQVTMATVVVDCDAVHIPAWVVDLDSFRRWVHSDEVPEKLRVCFLDGEVWVDMSNEQFFSHNQIKSEFNIVLGGLVKAERLGRYVPDGMLLTNVEANLSAGPDAVFVSRENLTAGRVRLVEGKKGGYVELEGTPDMVLEVMSAGSVKKDTVTLRELYWKAEVLEYWLVDARGEEPEFTILRRGPKDYAPARKQGGWLKSAVFGKSFRLTWQTAEDGNPEYTLGVR